MCSKIAENLKLFRQKEFIEFLVSVIVKTESKKKTLLPSLKLLGKIIDSQDVIDNITISFPGLLTQLNDYVFCDDEEIISNAAILIEKLISTSCVPGKNVIY